MKTLVIFYSKDGNTKRQAALIAQKANADLAEIKISRTYDADDWKASDQAIAEQKSGDLPPITSELPDIAPYDTILVGGAVWGQSLSNPIRSYLAQTDFVGKTVSAFWTFYDHDENYNADFAKFAKNARYEDGLPLPRKLTGSAEKLNAAVEAWLKTL